MIVKSRTTCTFIFILYFDKLNKILKKKQYTATINQLIFISFKYMLTEKCLHSHNFKEILINKAKKSSK